MNRHFQGAVCAVALLAAGAAPFAADAALAATADQPGHQSPAPGTSNDTMSAVKDTTAGAVGVISAEMTTTTRGFVAAAATSDMYEVEAGKIAEKRAQSDDVKAFAAKMVEAHTGTTRKLKAIIASNNINVTPPAHLDNRRQGMIDDLRGAKAADFDHRYLAQQEAAHKEADILMRGYIKDGDNAAIKSFAAETSPAVQDHLQMVKDLEAGKKSSM